MNILLLNKLTRKVKRSKPTFQVSTIVAFLYAKETILYLNNPLLKGNCQVRANFLAQNPYLSHKTTIVPTNPQDYTNYDIQ